MARYETYMTATSPPTDVMTMDGISRIQTIVAQVSLRLTVPGCVLRLRLTWYIRGYVLLANPQEEWVQHQQAEVVTDSLH